MSQGNDSLFLPVPATFIVGRDGLIKARHVDRDYRTRMEIDKVLEALRQAAQGYVTLAFMFDGAADARALAVSGIPVQYTTNPIEAMAASAQNATL